MKNKIKPLAKFRVYVWRSSLYFEVYVWETQEQLLNSRIKNKLAKYRDTQAYVLSFDVKKKGKKLPIVGQIHFYKRRLGTEIIVHESCHATISVLTRLKFSLAAMEDFTSGKKRMKQEEIFCYVGGNMAKDIVNKLYKFKLISQ